MEEHRGQGMGKEKVLTSLFRGFMKVSAVFT
jgi:hypothetical protein